MLGIVTEQLSQIAYGCDCEANPLFVKQNQNRAILASSCEVTCIFCFCDLSIATANHYGALCCLVRCTRVAIALTAVRDAGDEEIAGLATQLGIQLDTPRAKMNLAILWVDLGDRAVARDLYNEVVAGSTSHLVVQHADTLGTKMNLANLLMDLGECTTARGPPK